MVFDNLNQKIDTSKVTPVIGGDDFAKLKDEILSK